jgi:hypothetical protein
VYRCLTGQLPCPCAGSSAQPAHHAREAQAHRGRPAARGDQRRVGAREEHPPRPSEHASPVVGPPAARRLPGRPLRQPRRRPLVRPERFPTPKDVEDERTRLFGIIERLVLWENSTNEAVLEEARAEIRRSTGGNPPPVLDPFCGGGSIPLEAQRLGLAAYASDLNRIIVLITKALIEIRPSSPTGPSPRRPRGVGSFCLEGAPPGWPRTSAATALDARRGRAPGSATSTRRSACRRPRRGDDRHRLAVGPRSPARTPPAAPRMPLVARSPSRRRARAGLGRGRSSTRTAKTVRFEVRTGTMPKKALTGTSAVAVQAARRSDRRSWCAVRHGSRGRGVHRRRGDGRPE